VPSWTESQPYPLAPLLEEIIEDHRPLLRNEDVSLSLNVEAPAETVIRPELIRLIVGNLLRNSLQSTSKGEVSITLGSQNIGIRDSGYGTPGEVIDWVNNLSANLIPHNKTGIGLFIVMRLCKRLNLEVKASSRPTGGAEFTLTW
jgi:two-component system sensor histidine kinase QseC